VIDVHCHILAEVDDGAKSWEMSDEMCRMAADDGIEHIVATPHANRQYIYDRDFLNDALNTLRRRAGGRLRFSLGCDFHLSLENINALKRAPEIYCIEGTRYLLVEPSNSSIPPHIDDALGEMRELELTPIITHPERNPILQQTPERVLAWIRLGCIVQVTASAITGFWGERVWQSAQWLLRRNAVHVLATDAHDPVHRVPVLSTARKEVADEFGEDLARSLVDANPRAIVNNEPLPYAPDLALEA
jgi:protein-tyrosine phosphatase